MSLPPTSAATTDASLPGPSFIRLSTMHSREDITRSGDMLAGRGDVAQRGEVPGDDSVEPIPDVSSSWNGSPVRRAEPISHLPTPQSSRVVSCLEHHPRNLSAYTDPFSYGSSSPLRTGSRDARSLGAKHPSFDYIEVSRALVTPESSPLVSRRPKSSTMSATSPPRTPPLSGKAMYAPQEFATPIPPSPRSVITPTHSGLSSPFVDKSERDTPNKASSRPSPGSPFATPSQADDDVFMTSKLSPPLPAPIPQRATGGEITRLRLQIAAERAAQQQETESRRPDYLRRTKRPLSDIDDEAVGDRENAIPTLGVTHSPIKGRRLALFQETSEESFEQSLLAGGYPSYGVGPGYAEPTTPQNSGASALSQRAVDWIQQATPGHQASPRMTVAKDDVDPPHNEQDARKRRRLEAFKDHNVTTPHKKLHAVEVEGRGRVLLDELPDDLPLQQAETPTKKRNARRKRGGVPDSPSRRKVQIADSNDEDESNRPNWLDQAFPWSMRVHERKDMAVKEEELKLKWIERYLERESDEDEEQDQSLGLPSADLEEPPVRRGRGKMVPLTVNPKEPSSSRPARARKYHPSDPADARAALLSKRSVRAFAYRTQREQEEVVCICHGKDDGRELVQCDDCKDWFHLHCIGITDVAELGREEDPWYCPRCLGVPVARSSSPTFVPTDDRPSARGRRDPLFFQGAAHETPPGIAWNTPRIPKTPVRERDLTHQLSSRSSWDDSSSQAGPQTPSTGHRSPRVYHTPASSMPMEEIFDPSSTPSRGMHFSGPFATPKPPGLWPSRSFAGQSPSRPAKKHPAPWAFDNRDDSSPQRPVYDDSPIRRSQPRQEKEPFTRRIQESPLASRSTALRSLGHPRSPLSIGALIDRSHSRSAFL